MSIFENAFSSGVWIALVSTTLVGTFALSFTLRRENSMPHAASYAAKARLQKLRSVYAYIVKLDSCHKRQKPQAPTPQAPIRNRQRRKVAKAKGLIRNTNLT